MAHCPDCGTTIAFHDRDKVECYACGTLLVPERHRDPSNGLTITTAVPDARGNPPPVRTKMDFVRRYKAGEFGNAAPTWDNAEDFYYSRYDGLVHIRNRLKGAETWYDVPARFVRDVWAKAIEKYSPGQLYISAMAPTERTLFQGEVQQSPVGLQLFYTTVAKPMRNALAERSEHVEGVRAAQLLRYYLCPNSHEWLQVLLDRYPGHVVEFSTYGVEWGTLPGFNTVFWEVRNY